MEKSDYDGDAREHVRSFVAINCLWHVNRGNPGFQVTKITVGCPAKTVN
ncbi:hypothetical protein LHA01_26730 [Schleiferilactobacillus harbinensis]|jgi:hypothetical protein|nr:hypothetical protein LHA01_26730 [Schleiferilactobacillus harbinensis]